MSPPDWRLHPYRADLAAASLRGIVDAPRYVDGLSAYVCAPSVLLVRSPQAAAPVDSELLHGEPVEVYDQNAGWSWVQSKVDGYVGYVQSAALQPGAYTATHRVRVSRTHIYPGASIKTADRGVISMGALLQVAQIEGDFAELSGNAGFVFAKHLAPIGQYEGDHVDVARCFLHAPYRWGGRSSIGLDCSGLIQMTLAACGINCPRDTDMQEQTLGIPIVHDLAALRRGDLVFWKGHVGIVSAPDMLLHATGYVMQVIEEPLQAAVDRIAGQGLPITSIKRLQ